MRSSRIELNKQGRIFCAINVIKFGKLLPWKDAQEYHSESAALPSLPISDGKSQVAPQLRRSLDWVFALPTVITSEHPEETPCRIRSNTNRVSVIERVCYCCMNQRYQDLKCEARLSAQTDDGLLTVWSTPEWLIKKDTVRDT